MDSTHVVAFVDFVEATDALTLLVRNGYRKLECSLERLAPKTARIVPGRALALPRGRFVVVWMDGGLIMKAVAGSVVLLAGAVLFAGGAVAEATLTAVQRSGYSGWHALAMGAGALVGLTGLALVAVGWQADSAPRS